MPVDSSSSPVQAPLATMKRSAARSPAAVRTALTRPPRITQPCTGQSLRIVAPLFSMLARSERTSRGLRTWATSGIQTARSVCTPSRGSSS